MNLEEIKLGIKEARDEHGEMAEYTHSVTLEEIEFLVAEVERLRLKIENIRWYVCDHKEETPDEIAERTKNWSQDARGDYRGGPW